MSSASNRSLTLLVAAFAGVVLVNYLLHARATYLEYYGDGPPYYGRTTNMDKWQSPVNKLLLSNGGGLALIAVVAYASRRLPRRRP